MWQSRPRVLLLDEGWAQTLELAAALADAAHAVTIVTVSDRASPRRWHGIDWHGCPELASPQLIPWIESLVTHGGFDHVLPLTEGWMYWLWQREAAWIDRVHPATVPWQRELLRDKYRMAAYVAARGVGVPRQRRLDAADGDADQVARALGLPVVIKGARGAGGARVRIAETAAQLAAAVREAGRDDGGWGVQELIDGPTFLVGGLFEGGRAVRLYAAEKLAQHPPRTGPAIRLRSDADPALLAPALAIMRALRWTGFASVDFVRAPDGRYLFLEVNPRPWGSLAAARLAGVELFQPFTELLAGRVPAADLAFAVDLDCWVFPRYLLSPTSWGLAGAVRAVRDLLGPAGRVWRDPQLVRHALRRLRSPRPCGRT